MVALLKNYKYIVKLIILQIDFYKNSETRTKICAREPNLVLLCLIKKWQAKHAPF